jgi:hypothetical protein
MVKSAVSFVMTGKASLPVSCPGESGTPGISASPNDILASTVTTRSTRHTANRRSGEQNCLGAAALTITGLNDPDGAG